MSNVSDTVQERGVRYLSNMRGITDVSAIRQPEEIAGGGMLVTTQLKREGRDTWGWYYEKGEITKALFTGEEIAKFISQQVAPKTFKEIMRSTPLIELVRMVVISVLTLLFSISVVFVVIRDPQNQSLQILNGLLGLTIGYFIGKVEK